MYGIEIPISTYRTQGAITFKVLSLKHTEISASRYFLRYKKNSSQKPAGIFIPKMPSGYNSRPINDRWVLCFILLSSILRRPDIIMKTRIPDVKL